MFSISHKILFKSIFRVLLIFCVIPNVIANIYLYIITIILNSLLKFIFRKISLLLPVYVSFEIKYPYLVFNLSSQAYHDEIFKFCIKFINVIEVLKFGKIII